MFRTSWVCFLAAAALAQTNNQAPADSAKVAPGIEISSGTGTLKSGVGSATRQWRHPMALS